MTAGDTVDSLRTENPRAAVLDTADKTGLDKLSEVTVFAVPLFHQGDLVQLVYLPVAAKDVSGDPSNSKVPQKVRDYAQKAQTKFDTMWSQWGARDKGMRRRVHDLGQRQVENVSPESRLLTGIKRGTKQLTVYHPSSIPDEVVNRQMAAIAASQGKTEYWKLSAACAALPVALAVDTLVLIGLPPMLTGYTGYLSYKHYKGASGAATLKKLGQGPTSQQPLSAGLAKLQTAQPHQGQQQPRPLTDNTNTEAYTGFAPQSVSPGSQSVANTATHNAQGSYPGQDAESAPFQPQSGAPEPSDQRPQTYQSMLDSLPSADTADGSGPVHYPNIQAAQPFASAVPSPPVSYLAQATASSNLSGGASGHNPHDVAAGKSLNSGAASVSAGQAGAPVPVVGMEFIAVPALDDFVTRVAETPDGALSEQDILELCSVIKAPELVKPLMELKQRQLRLVNKAKKQGSQ